MLLRILIISVVLWFLFSWVKRKLRASQANTPPRSGRKAAVQAETLVACHVCGVHLPINQARSRNGHSYCSQHI